MKHIDNFIKQIVSYMGNYDFCPQCGVTKRKNAKACRNCKRFTREHKERIGQAHLGKLKPPLSEEHKKKISDFMKQRKLSAEHKRKIGLAHKGKHVSQETRALIGKYSQERWDNGQWREKQIKKIMSGWWNRPTSLEKQMIEIIERYSLPYKYVGDGSFLIGFKNPDFININSKKICVEVANIYHHDDNYETKRKKHFKNYGWECVVFRGDELREEQVLQALQ